MKSLPSLKEKRRYLVFEVISAEKHSFAEVRESVIGAVSAFLGVSGLAKAKPRLLSDKWDGEKQRGIIVVNRKGIEHIKAALCLAGKVGQSKAIIRSLGVSGILRKAIKNFYMTDNQGGL